MIRRLIWFVSGVVAGVSGVLFAGRRVKKTVGSLAPVKVVGKAADATRDKARTIAEASGGNARIAIGEQHEAAPHLDRAAEMHPDLLHARASRDLELLQQVGERQRVQDLVDHQPHRPFR